MRRVLAQRVERVLFINVYRPIGWEFYINKKVPEGVARWPATELIDWELLAHLCYDGARRMSTRSKKG